MKRYLLDTSLVAAFLHGRPTAIELIAPWVKNGQATTSILVYGEVIEYLKGLATFTQYKTRLQQPFTLNQITPYPLTYPIWSGMLISGEPCDLYAKRSVILIP